MYRRSYVLSIVALIGGAGLALLATSQAWAVLSLHRAAPLPDVTARIAGHSIEPAVTGLAVVALAGAVALLATSGALRRVAGGALSLVGTALVWRSVTGAAVSGQRARELLAARRTGAVLSSASELDVHRVAGWPVLSALGGVTIALAGVATVLLGARWRALSSRYEAPSGPTQPVQSTPPTQPVVDPVQVAVGATIDAQQPGLTGQQSGRWKEHAPRGEPCPSEDGEQRRQRADAALWRSVDRGDDPTVG